MAWSIGVSPGKFVTHDEAVDAKWKSPICVAMALVAATCLTGAAAAQDGKRPRSEEASEKLAQAQGTVGFDIPAQPLSSALTAFGSQSGYQVSVDHSTLANLRSTGVAGRMTPEEALRRLLAGTGVTWRFAGGRSVYLTKAPDGQQGAIRLDPVQVQGYLVPAQAMIDNIPPPYAGGQVATGSQLGLLGNRDVMNTPFNQTSYTAKKAQDQQAKTVRDVLIDDPSVLAVSANGGIAGDNLRIRGFEALSSDVTYGGLYGILPTWSIMAELAERIEVLKGPSAMLNGMQPGRGFGGTVNLVAKRAPDEPLTQVTAGYNSAAQFGAAADVGRRFGPDKQFGVRFNGVFRAGQTAVEWSADQRALAALGLDFRGERVRLSADLGYQNQYLGGVIPWALLANGVPLPWAPNASKNFGQPWNYQELKDLFGVVRGEVDLTERITAYAAFGAHDFRRSALLGGNVVTISNFNGNATSTPQAQSQWSRNLTGEAGLRALVDTGPIGHEFAFSAKTLEVEGGSAAITGTPFATNIYNPTLIPRANLATPAMNKTFTAGQSSLALADTLSAADKRIQLTVGARLQRVTSANFNAVTGAQTSNYDQSALSPSVALVFKPWRNVSVYGNWIQGLQQGTIVGAQFTNAGEVFPPFKSTQYEVGVKVDWGRFTTTASVFQITQPSTIIDVATNTLTLDGEQRNQGLELNFFGEPIPGVRLLGGAMFLDAVLAKTQGGLADGWRAPTSPDVQLRLGAEWDTPFARGLTLDGRIVYVSSQYIDTTSPRRSLAGWTRLDLGARYTFDNVRSPTDKPVVIRFNVENVLDANYWMAPSWLGAPRTFRLSTSFDF